MSCAVKVKVKDGNLKPNAAVSDNDDNVMIFENISASFSFYIFVKQFVIHLTGPLFMWSTNAVNQGYCSISNADMNHVTPMIVFAMLASAFISFGPSLSANGALWIPLMYFILHKFQIAVKYACLSKTEYEKFMSTDPVTADKYQNQMMLVSGWLNRPQDVIEFEISAAALRCGLDISNLEFFIPNPDESDDKLSQFRNWRALLLSKATITDSEECPELVLQPDGSYTVSIFHVCQGLIRHNELWKGQFLNHAGYIVGVLVLLNLLIPVLLLPLKHDPIPQNGWNIAFFITASITTMTFSGIIFNFMTVAVYDVVRQRNLFKAARMMMRISDFHYSKEDHTFVRQGVNLLATSTRYVDNSSSFNSSNGCLNIPNTARSINSVKIQNSLSNDSYDGISIKNSVQSDRPLLNLEIDGFVNQSGKIVRPLSVKRDFTANSLNIHNITGNSGSLKSPTINRRQSQQQAQSQQQKARPVSMSIFSNISGTSYFTSTDSPVSSSPALLVDDANSSNSPTNQHNRSRSSSPLLKRNAFSHSNLEDNHLQNNNYNNQDQQSSQIDSGRLSNTADMRLSTTYEHATAQLDPFQEDNPSFGNNNGGSNGISSEMLTLHSSIVKANGKLTKVVSSNSSSGENDINRLATLNESTEIDFGSSNDQDNHRHLNNTLGSINSSAALTRHDDAHNHVVGVILHGDNEEAAIPRVYANRESNIVAWTYTRILLQHFGDRFRFRLDVFVGIILLTVLILIISALVIAFTTTSELFFGTFVVMSLFTVLIVFFFLVYFTLQGAFTNDELDQHRGALTAHIMKLVRKQTELNKECVNFSSISTAVSSSSIMSPLANIQMQQRQQQLQSNAERLKMKAVIDSRKACFESCLTVIENYNALKPFTVIGVPATFGITSSLVSGAITFFGVLYGAYQPNLSKNSSTTTTTV